MKLLKPGMLMLILFYHLHTRAQGCSDAGFCTSGALKGGEFTHDSTIEKKGIQWGASITAGSGEKGTTLLTPQIEATYYFSPASTLDARLPVTIASGNLGRYSGLGDMIINYTRSVFNHRQKNLAITLGTRIGLGRANATNNGTPLSMPYQSSLGTTDIIAGLNFEWNKYVGCAGGYQQPVLQYNKNGYLPDVIYPDMPTDHQYFASRELRRKGDILLRADAHYRWRKSALALGPLLIYHLGEDQYTDVTGQRASLKGSGGATLNLAGTFSYHMKKGTLELQGGTPFIVRDYRPDGLTRAWVITLRYARRHS